MSEAAEPQRHPFVFVAGYPRSGSTALAEALTEWPGGFVHSEPGLCRGRLEPYALERVPEPHASAVAPAVAEARAILAETPAGAPLLRAYLRRVVPLLPYAQVGIKEVAFRRYLHRQVLDERPDARVLVTVRDPRDVWLSLEEMGSRFPEASWSYRGHGPDEAAVKVAGLDRQLAELVVGGALVVRYEDLCTDPGVLDRARAHVRSPVTGGSLGLFTSDRRGWEAGRHGQALSPGSVGRWRTAAAGPRRRADRFAGHLGEYRERYGYR